MIVLLHPKLKSGVELPSAGVNIGSWDHHEGKFTFGINGIVGLEYKVASIPLAFSLDYKPNLNVIGKTGFHAADFGLGIKVTF